MQQQEHAAISHHQKTAESGTRGQLLARLQSQGLLKPGTRGIEDILDMPGVPNQEAAMAAAAAMQRPVKTLQQQQQEQQQLFAELVRTATVCHTDAAAMPADQTFHADKAVAALLSFGLMQALLLEEADLCYITQLPTFLMLHVMCCHCQN